MLEIDLFSYITKFSTQLAHIQGQDRYILINFGKET